MWVGAVRAQSNPAQSGVALDASSMAEGSRAEAEEDPFYFPGMQWFMIVVCAPSLQEAVQCSKPKGRSALQVKCIPDLATTASLPCTRTFGLTFIDNCDHPFTMMHGDRS